ncbi:MAG TPA: endonuclease/exonuclease/phosphatase family protein [Syntrophomonadaceae bacterium]|nr:endonuclease/exonuclease/phosphatase family protein [Syntrophomonadaceae bacterium]
MLIKVVTFNIHHGTDINNQPSLNNIYLLLKQIQADIINLQELDMQRPQTSLKKQAAILAQKLGMYYVYGPVRTYEKGSYGNAILSIYPIVSNENMDLGESNDRRYCLKANINIKDYTISIFNTHLGLSQPKRYKQLKDIILPNIFNNNHPTILAGDFNAPTTRPEILMLSSILTDTFVKNSGILQHTFPSDHPQARIDYIFTNSHLTPVDYYIMDANVSDHLPVITMVEI